MSINVRTEGDVRIIELTGEIAMGGGLASLLDLRGDRLLNLSDTLRTVLQEGSLRILLDLRKVGFLDSGGLGALVAWQKRTRQIGGDIRLLRPTRRVLELFEMTNLTRVFRIFDDEAEALASFRD